MVDKTLKDYLIKCKHPIDFLELDDPTGYAYCQRCLQHGELLGSKFIPDESYKSKDYVVGHLKRLLRKLDNEEKAKKKR
jgi:hypothetical protein